MDFPNSSVVKESTCNAGDPSSIPALGRSAGEGIGYPLQYTWVSLVAHLVKNLPECWRPGLDPWVGNIPWWRERLPTPVFWPREFHGLDSPWGHKESDTTERLSLSPFPTPGDLPDPRIDSTSPTLAGVFFTSAPPRKSQVKGSGFVSGDGGKRASLEMKHGHICGL